MPTGSYNESESNLRKSSTIAHMTIPQLKHAQDILDEKLKNKNLGDFDRAKIERMKSRYVKAQYLINKHWKKTYNKQPGVTARNRNTLTLLEIYQNKVLKPGIMKNEGFNGYNALDAFNDVKGIALGIGATAIGLGAANSIANAFGTSVPALLKQALKWLGPVNSSLILGGAALVVASKLIPALRRKADQMRKNRTYAQELQNELTEDIHNNLDGFDPSLLEAKNYASNKNNIVQTLFDNYETLSEYYTNLLENPNSGLNNSQRQNLIDALKEARDKYNTYLAENSDFNPETDKDIALREERQKIEEARRKLEEAENQLEEAKKKLAEEREQFEKEVEESDMSAEERADYIAQKEKEFADKEAKLGEIESKINKREQSLKEREEEISNLKKDVKDANKRANEANKKVNDARSAEARQRKRADDAEAEVQRLKEELEKSKNQSKSEEKKDDKKESEVPEDKKDDKKENEVPEDNKDDKKESEVPEDKDDKNPTAEESEEKAKKAIEKLDKETEKILSSSKNIINWYKSFANEINLVSSGDKNNKAKSSIKHRIAQIEGKYGYGNLSDEERSELVEFLEGCVDYMDKIRQNPGLSQKKFSGRELIQGVKGLTNEQMNELFGEKEQ